MESGFSDQHFLLDSMTTALGSIPQQVRCKARMILCGRQRGTGYGVADLAANWQRRTSDAIAVASRVCRNGNRWQLAFLLHMSKQSLTLPALHASPH